MCWARKYQVQDWELCEDFLLAAILLGRQSYFEIRVTYNQLIIYVFPPISLEYLWSIY